MAEKNILDVLNALTTELLSFSPSDEGDMRQVRERLDTLGKWAGSDNAVLAGAIDDARAALSSMHDSEEPEELLQTVAELVGELRDAVEKGASPEDIDVRTECFNSAGTESGGADDADGDDADDCGDGEIPEGLLMLLDDPETAGEFLQESEEHLLKAELALMELEKNSEDSESVNVAFRAFHTIKGLAGFFELDQVRTLSHSTENLMDEIRSGKAQMDEHNAEVVLRSVSTLEEMLHHIREAVGNQTAVRKHPEYDRLLGDIAAAMEREPVAAGGTHAQDNTAETGDDGGTNAAGESGSGERTDKKAEGEGREAGPGGAATEEPATASAAPEPVAPESGRTSSGTRAAKPGGAGQKAVKEMVRVDAGRLDRLIEVIGEMVIAESMVSRKQQEAGGASSLEFEREMDRLDKITRELQEIGMSLRMIPIKPLFQRMIRLVRDVARENGKKVDLELLGEETELDKSVVDQLSDPFVHLIRNAVDHGIEAPEVRSASGKPETGHIELRAFHRGGNIFIEIEDDGAGLDREKILAKAREKGLVGEESDKMDDKDVYSLIFEPGFSTKTQVSDLSGRGVGMDVVRRNVEAIRGQIDVRSGPAAGTVISIRLPLTLAIIDGMVVRVGEERYVIPTLSIVQTLRPEKDSVKHVRGQGDMVDFQGSLSPIFWLGEMLGGEGEAEEASESVIVMVDDDGKRVGFVVDELLGQQQIVIKSLGKGIGELKGIAGAAIMPDGKVGLILDVNGLIKLAG